MTRTNFAAFAKIKKFVDGMIQSFESDRLDLHYGNEVDLAGSLRRGRATFSARYARYRADAFATDTDKFWLSLDWAL